VLKFSHNNLIIFVNFDTVWFDCYYQNTSYLFECYIVLFKICLGIAYIKRRFI